MKVLVVIIFAVGSVAAGSGPYLPSGWKPEGPAFYLPSEVQKPSENPLEEILFQESEASGSDTLREYGPPKLDESPLQASNQGLPDVITEQSFFAADIQTGTVSEIIEAINEEVANFDVNTEVTAVETTTVTDSQDAITEIETTESNEQSTSEYLIEVQPTIQGSVELQSNFENKALELGQVTEFVEQTSEVSQEEITEKVEEVEVIPNVVIQEIVQENESAGANNIAEALENLEKENKIQAVETVTELNGFQETTRSLEQAPEGFLEYGPPGFREYGPPNEEDLVRSAIDQVVSADAVENNEVRRRRFSPKFRPSRINKKLH